MLLPRFFIILFLLYGEVVLAQVVCDPNIAPCPNPPPPKDNDQAPEGLELASRQYYANRKSKMQLNSQNSAKLEQDLRRCLPPSYRSIMRRVVRHESGNNPFAVNINLGPKLDKQPISATESARIARTYLTKGYSVDLGYAQINSQHYASPDGFLHKAGYGVDDMFNPCINLQAGALILGEAYLRYHDMGKALSVYNTGNTTKGFSNGYVNKVLKMR